MSGTPWFIAGTVVLMLAGALHALYALRDTARPRYFAPIDRSVQAALEGTGMRLVGQATPSIWRVWLGVHISHGVGIFSFALLCLVIAVHDYELVERIDAIGPLSVAFSAVYLVLSLRFWFYLPVIITGTATVCFSVAAVLSL